MTRSVLVETVMERLFSSTLNLGGGNVPIRMTLGSGLLCDLENRIRIAPSMIGRIERTPPSI
jgi:hypothetical protein